MKLMNVRTFIRGGYLSVMEPVQVIRGQEVIGLWQPVAPGQAPIDDDLPVFRSPASRSEPVNPSGGGLPVGPKDNAETDQAQSGAPDPGPGLPARYERPSSGVEGTPASPEAVVRLMRPVIVDPRFNSKGSRPAPKTGGHK